MKLYIIALGLLCLVSCQSEQRAGMAPTDRTPANRSDAMRTAATPKVETHDFQRLHNDVNFMLPGETMPGFAASLPDKKEFLDKSGFSSDPRLLAELVGKTTWQQADQRYRSFMVANANHPMLPLFRRYASTVILRNLALLAEDDVAGKKAIAFYLGELAQVKGGVPAGIYYYGLRAMAGYWSKEQTRTYVSQVLAEHDSDKNFAQIKQMATEPEQMMTQMKAASDEDKQRTMQALMSVVGEEDDYLDKLRAML